MISEHDLREIPFLQELSREELAKLISVLKERTVSAGNYILYAEDPGPSLMFISHGEAKVNLLGADGKEIVIALLGQGDFFGEIAILTGEDRTGNVVAETDCRLFVLAKEDFEKHVLSNSGLALSMLKSLALRLRASSLKIGDLALFDVYRRVARTLKSIATRTEENGEEVYVIDKRPTHQELAAMVGTSREMVTRALKGLEEDGCVVTEGKRVLVRKLPL